MIKHLIDLWKNAPEHLSKPIEPHEKTIRSFDEKLDSPAEEAKKSNDRFEQYWKNKENK